MGILTGLALLWFGAIIGALAVSIAVVAKDADRRAAEDEKRWRSRLQIARLSKDESGSMAVEYAVVAFAITVSLYLALAPLAQWASHTLALLAGYFEALQ